MKRVFLIVLFLSVNCIAVAQDYKKEIEKDFSQYMSLIVNKKFDQSMDYAFPELFEIVPRTQMVKAMEQVFSDTTIQFNFEIAERFDIGNVKKVDGKYYSLVSYVNQMNIKSASEEAETEDEKKASINITQLVFEEAFGSGNVKYNDATGFFEIHAPKQAYARSENGQTDWKFLVIEKKQKVILEKLLPKALTKKL